MLSPTFLNGELTYRIEELMNDIEAEMLGKVAHYVSKFRTVTGSAEFLSMKQREYGLLYNDLLNIVAKRSEMTTAEIARMYQQSAANSIAYDNKVIASAQRSGIFSPTLVSGTGSVLASSMNRTLEAAILRAVNVQNLTNTKCLQSALELFTRATDKAFLSVSTGAATFENAYKQAVDEIVQSGVSVVEYTRSGKLIKYSVEAATRRNLITSISQTCGQISIMNAQALGVSLFQVTSHAGARPSHAEWQGGRYWYGTPVKGYGSLVDDCGYGEADGLKGINCYHDFYPCFEGSPNHYDRDPARKLGISNDELYYQRQEQHRYERDIRAAKKEREIYAAAGMTDEARAAGAKVRERQAAIRGYLDEHPHLVRDYSREAIG